MRNASKFDLVVIGHQQRTPITRSERCTKHTTFICTNGNIVQVRLVATETTCSCDSLIESGVNTIIRRDFRQQTFTIGRAQFFNFAKAQQRSDELWPRIMKFLQGCRISTETCLCLLSRRQPMFCVQNLAQLRWGVHVELTACNLMQRFCERNSFLS